jgi:hypothetical protein
MICLHGTIKFHMYPVQYAVAHVAYWYCSLLRLARSDSGYVEWSIVAGEPELIRQADKRGLAGSACQRAAESFNRNFKLTAKGG